MGNSNTETNKQGTMVQNDQAANGLNSVNAMLNQQAMGQGPVNQASQAQLQNATNQGVANAAGVMANAKGLNPAMAARMAGQNAAQSTQQGANASAALTAQNSMAAQNQLSSNYSNELNTTQGGVNAINSANAGANTGNQQAFTQGIGGLFNGASSGMSSMMGGGGGGASSAAGAMANGGLVQNYDDGGDVTPPPATPPPSQPAAAPSSGGGGGGASSLLPLLLLAANGGQVRRMYDNGGVASQPAPIFGGDASSASSSGPKSAIGKALKGAGSGIANPSQSAANNYFTAGTNLGQTLTQGIFGGGNSDAAPQPAATDADASPTPSPMFKGGKAKNVPAMVSPGERYLPPKAVEKVARGKENPMKAGEKIPGKAKVPGNSLANDTVPKTLKEGGIVLPRSVTESKNPHWEAMKFVRAHMNKLKMGK